MCGIVGSSFKKTNIDNAVKSIVHRGPDGTRIERFNECVLGFVRLAIRDLSDAAMQPFTGANNDVWIVYNGEIYGEQKLKQRLVEKGYDFKTESDTEVIYYAYLEYGDQFIDYIDGMFAIAVLDIKKRRLHLFRDRVGIKPLYYYYDGNNISFASEIKAIIELHSDVDFEVDNTAVYDFFTYRYVPEPKTIYKNIFALEAASCLEYDLDKKDITIRKYWDLKVNSHLEHQKKREDVLEELLEIIKKSVNEHLVSDVPVGVFLSGGIDSSVVATEIFKLRKDVKAFSMGFEIDNPQNYFYDETRYAGMLAEKYGFDIIYDKFDRLALFDNLYESKTWFDEPFADTSSYPTYQISKVAKENNIEVVLTGDGGDELFGGYTRYNTFNQKVNKRPQKSLLSDLYTKILEPYIEICDVKDILLDAVSLYAQMTYANDRTKKGDLSKLLGIGYGYDDFWYFRKYYHDELPPITRVQYVDFMTYLPSDILKKVDRVSMANSIETRVPLLSTRLIEFAFELSQEDRIIDNDLKGLLKMAYSGAIPHEILYKEKKGFSFPGDYWSNGRNDRDIIWNAFLKG